MNDAVAEAVAEPTPVETLEVDHASEATPIDAVDRAFEAVEAQEAETEAKAPETTEDAPEPRERNEDGTFKAKEKAEGEETESDTSEEQEAEEPEAEAEPETPTQFAEAPSRFSPESKAEWAKAPEAVRAEIHRAVSELESGLSEYKDKFEPYKRVAARLDETGQNIDEVFERYTGIEDRLRVDPIGGLHLVCENMGISLRDVASHILGQTPDQNAAQQDSVIRELKGTIAELTNEIKTIQTDFQAQQQQALHAQIEEFKKDAPRFEDLRDDISMFLQTDRAKDLQEAYDLAERLNPAPVVPTPTVEVAKEAAPKPDREAQTQKGQKSLNGAPASGSNPKAKGKPKSVNSAIDNAFASVGL